MDIDRLSDKLSPLERKTLSCISEGIIFFDLVNNTGLKDIEVMRALQWLGNKGIVEIKEEQKELIFLGENGKEYKKKGLPERKFLESIKNQSLSLNQIEEKTDLSQEEISICIGVLRKKAAIDIEKKDEILFKANLNSIKMLEKESSEERFLKKKFPLQFSELDDEERFAFDNLIKRKDIIKKENQKTRRIFLTDLGKEIAKTKSIDEDRIDKLTPEAIRSGSWKNKKFRHYDVEINVPIIYRGKRHFVNQAVKSARRIWLDMGFQEMKGNMIQTSFWNFDALFTAQDHPVREMQDTFFISFPKNGKLPQSSLVKKVKDTHENGGETGSKGWAYNWDEKKAARNVLRTHTTVLSARMLNSINKKEIPSKYFALGKCFRNETLDWSHLFEFNQTEGIVIDSDANFRHLLGYLKEFFRKMGYEKARFRPAYFPYTELSVEIDVFHPVHKKWFELGGAGIFRPEVVKPLLGTDTQVLAWGPGFDRLILDFFGIQDIRDLYKNDINQLRSMKEWMR